MKHDIDITWDLMVKSAPNFTSMIKVQALPHLHDTHESQSWHHLVGRGSNNTSLLQCRKEVNILHLVYQSASGDTAVTQQAPSGGARARSMLLAALILFVFEWLPPLTESVQLKKCYSHFLKSHVVNSQHRLWLHTWTSPVNTDRHNQPVWYLWSLPLVCAPNMHHSPSWT